MPETVLFCKLKLMKKGIFIVGNDSALCRAVDAEAAKRADNYAISLIPNRFAAAQKQPVQTSEKRIFLEWNPSSPISARTLVIAAENRLETIDHALLVCAPPPILSAAGSGIKNNVADTPLADIEIMINDHVKSWFFLVKEVAIAFANRKHGNLVLIFPDNTGSGKDEITDVLIPSALASFRALTNSLLSAAYNEPYTTMGFSCSDTGSEPAFASFIFKTIDEGNKRSSGKLHKFGKFSFFK